MSTHSYPRSFAPTSRSSAPASPFAREVYRAEEPRSGAREDVLDEIAALRAEVRTEVRALRGAMGRAKQNVELTTELAALRAAVDELLSVPKRGDAFTSLLRTLGIEGAAAAALSRLGKTKEKAKAKVGAHERLAQAVMSLVTTTAWPIAHMGPSLVALVGPAGVGKTTTAAKLGARARRARRSVAFISCDSYRVGAIDQLRRYAELMECEFHAVSNPDELLGVIARITADVIIVDTSGRAVEPGSVEAVLGDDRLRSSSFARHVEVMLCAPAALRSSDASRMVRAFAPTLPTALCITKLDETDAPSALVHAPFATKLPISTVCFGQRVPEDIASATVADVVARLVPAADADADAEASS